MTSSHKPVSPAEFYELCELHDWYYEFSDDNSVYREGRRQHDHLQQVAGSDGILGELFNAFHAHIYDGAPKPEKPT